MRHSAGEQTDGLHLLACRNCPQRFPLADVGADASRRTGVPSESRTIRAWPAFQRALPSAQRAELDFVVGAVALVAKASPRHRIVG